MDLDQKPGRRDKKPDGSTYRFAPRMRDNDATLDLVSGDAADGIQHLNLNKNGNWKVADELQKKEGVTVVKVENARLLKQKYEPKARDTSSKQEEEDDADDAAQEAASGKTKSKKSERKEKMRQKAEEEMTAKATETVYVVKCEIPERQRGNHKVLNRDGGETTGCSCRGCTGYVKERDKRAESKRELNNEINK